MAKNYPQSDYTDALLNIAVKKLHASDRVAAYQYCIEKEWLTEFGQLTDKGFHKVTANFYKDTTAAQ
tara:strand:- start:299 stop:499 length:201 start_codon:yes stop_codon:yes gene_type:complete